LGVELSTESDVQTHKLPHKLGTFCSRGSNRNIDFPLAFVNTSVDGSEKVNLRGKHIAVVIAQIKEIVKSFVQIC
jgi:hypothetical protein